MSNPKIINIESALEQLGDTDFYLELLDEFILSIPAKKELIIKAIKENDSVSLQQLGHSVKGVAANLHLPQIKNCATELESAAKKGYEDIFAKLNFELNIAFESLIEERKDKSLNNNR